MVLTPRHRPQFTPEHIWEKLRHIKELTPKNSILPNYDAIIGTLLEAEMELQGLMPWSSNYTFLVKLFGPDNLELPGIYKPGEGERPLWDFPSGSLAHREFASYLISQVLGWPKIPVTILRNGEHGLGSVQLFIEAEYEAHYFNMRDVPTFTDDFKDMALFDYIVNNADRKGGHCLKGRDGQIWAIDHGLTFHTEPKLRTVIWEFTDEAISEDKRADLARLAQLLDKPDFCRVVADLITPHEIEALKQRIGKLVKTGQFPPLSQGRNVPYPPI